MKALLRIAMGAALAAAVVTVLRKQQARARLDADQAFADSVGAGAGATAEPVSAQPAAATGAESSSDWYGAQIGDSRRH